jgi:hypothetical protein
VHLLLDANLSPKRIGSALKRAGHEVLCLAADPALGALDDPHVLELAATQSRILITRNSRDFAPLLRDWNESGRHHAGCILIWSLAHNEFGAIVDGVTRLLGEYPDSQLWQDLSLAL